MRKGKRDAEVEYTIQAASTKSPQNCLKPGAGAEPLKSTKSASVRAKGLHVKLRKCLDVLNCINLDLIWQVVPAFDTKLLQAYTANNPTQKLPARSCYAFYVPNINQRHHQVLG